MHSPGRLHNYMASRCTAGAYVHQLTKNVSQGNYNITLAEKANGREFLVKLKVNVTFM